MESITAAGSNTATVTGGSNSNNLQSSEFLSLLTAQLVNQDPLEPMSNEEMMNQVVSLQSMEGLENLRISIESLSRQRTVQAADLLGKEVELDYEGATLTGRVDSIRFSGNEANLIIDGRSYPESAIVAVRQS